MKMIATVSVFLLLVPLRIAASDRPYLAASTSSSRNGLSPSLTRQHLAATVKASPFEVEDSVLLFRGGTSSSGKKSKKGKSKSKKKKNTTTITKKKKRSTTIDDGSDSKSEAGSTSKKVLDELGNAIRQSRNELQNEDPLLQSIDWSVSSLGYSLGASDHLMGSEGGGVEVATTSVLANYFLKSHGGVHMLQCICSLLATISAVGAIGLKGKLRYTLLRRTMIFAMFKHCSGLFAAAMLSAKAIPKIGLGQSRLWIEQLVRDPVSQYVFYAALMLLWLSPRRDISSIWLMDSKWTLAVVVGPILLRELVSIVLVISDMLVLSNVGEDIGGIDALLKISKSMIDAVMSLLVSPKAWRNANSMERQAILAKIVSSISSVMEVAVGALLTADFMRGFGQLAFSNAANRPSFLEILVRLFCARLYVNFLWVRRRKLTKLATQLNNGASQLPMWVLNVLLDPLGSMGIERDRNKEPAWMKYLDIAATALGLDQ